MRFNLMIARKQKKMSQKDLAQHLGLSQKTVSAIELGNRCGKIEVWEALEELFNIPHKILRKKGPILQQAERE